MIAARENKGEKGSATMEAPRVKREVPRCTWQQLSALVLRCLDGAYEGEVTLFELGRFYRVIPSSKGERRDEVVCGVCGALVTPERAHVLASIVTCHADALKVLKEIKGNEEMRDVRIPIPYFRPMYGAAVQRRREKITVSVRDQGLGSGQQHDEAVREATSMAVQNEKVLANTHLALEKEVFDFFARPLSVDEIREYMARKNVKQSEPEEDSDSGGFDITNVKLPSSAKKRGIELPAGVEVHFSRRAVIPEVSGELYKQFTSYEFMRSWYMLVESQKKFRANVGADVFLTHPDRMLFENAIADHEKRWQERFPKEHADFRRTGLIRKKQKNGEVLTEDEKAFVAANPALFESPSTEEKKAPKKVFVDFALEEAKRTEEARQRELKIKNARAKKTEDLTEDEAMLLKDEDSKGKARAKRAQLESARRARQLENSASGPSRGSGKGKGKK